MWNKIKRMKSKHIVAGVLLLCAALLALGAGASYAAMGSIRSFTQIADEETDIVGKGSIIAEDGVKDAGFRVTLSGAGAVTRVTLKDTKAKRTWDTSPSDGVPVLVVRSGENDDIVNVGRSLGLLPFILGAEMTLWANDRASVLEKDTTFEVTVYFADKSSVTAELDVKGLPVAQKKTPEIVSADYKGLQKREVSAALRTSGGKKIESGEYLLTEVVFEGHGNIVGFRLRNTAGSAGTWDTAMDDASDLLIVLPKDAPAALNKPDGSVNIPVDGEKTYHLLVAPNEALSDPDARTMLYVYMDESRTIQKQVARAPVKAADTSAPRIKTVEFRGKGAYDFVGDTDKPGANLNPDSFIAVSLNASGTLSGIKLTGTWDVAGGKKKSATWDSVPSNSNPALVVTRADGKPLNRLDGSVSEAIGGDDNLLIWFDTGDPIEKGYAFTVTLLFSDGKVLEGKSSGSM